MPPGQKGAPAAHIRDQTCRVTGYNNSLDAAHIIPAAEASWFDSNKMKRYCSIRDGLKLIDDERNHIVLRRDIHPLFDARKLLIIAKAGSSPSAVAASSSTGADAVPLSRETVPSQLVLHVLPSGSNELIELYHNRRLQNPIRGIMVEFLFARFAWTLFKGSTSPFLDGCLSYAVRLFDPATGLQRTEQRAGPVRPTLRALFPPASRGSSSRKRQFSVATTECLDEAASDYGIDDDTDHYGSESQRSRGSSYDGVEAMMDRLNEKSLRLGGQIDYDDDLKEPRPRGRPLTSWPVTAVLDAERSPGRVAERRSVGEDDKHDGDDNKTMLGIRKRSLRNMEEDGDGPRQRRKQS